jgi:CAAX protease family protein
MSNYGWEEPPPPHSMAPDAASSSGPQSPDPDARRPAFSIAVTILCTVLTMFLVGLLLMSSYTRLGFLERPADDLARLVAREMDASEALQHAPRWEQAVNRFLSGNEDPLAQSIRWYDELPREFVSPRDELYRVILLAEAGRADRVSAAIVPWQYQGDAMRRMLEWVQAAYLGAPPSVSAGREIIAEIRAELSEEWFADILIARIAAGIDDRRVEKEAKSAIGARGAVLLNHRRALVILQLVAFVLGGFLLIRLVQRKGFRPLGTAPLPPQWSAEDGYALFIRGALAFLLVSIFAGRLLPDASAVTGVSTVLAGLPLLGLLMWYLGRKGLTLAQTFGLRIPSNAKRLVQMTVILMAAAIAGELLIASLVAFFHIKTDWTDGFMEDLLWKPWWGVCATVLDTVVWAPLMEEIAFRGVLYASLRTKLGVGPSAVLSAGGFALVHGYEAIGFVSVLWSGIIWALAYERTRSLWPGILAHSINNLLVTVEFILLYR